MSEKYLEKIAKLLVQAERASTPEEAEAFTARAQQLASATAIDLAVARAHAARKEQRSAPVVREIVLGERGKRHLRTYVKLFLAIARANDVTCDIAQNSTRIYPFGFPEDIEVVERLYASLVVQMVQASDAYLRSGAHKEETRLKDVYRHGYYVDTVRVPVHGSTARKSFQEAYAHRVGTRLREAHDAAVEAAKEAEKAAYSEDELRNLAENQGGKTGTELALVAKEVEVQDFYKTHSTAKGSWKGFRGGGSRSVLASAAGRRAADKARLGGHRELTA